MKKTVRELQGLHGRSAAEIEKRNQKYQEFIAKTVNKSRKLLEIKKNIVNLLDHNKSTLESHNNLLEKSSLYSGIIETISHSSKNYTEPLDVGIISQEKAMSSIFAQTKKSTEFTDDILLDAVLNAKLSVVQLLLNSNLSPNTEVTWKEEKTPIAQVVYDILVNKLSLSRFERDNLETILLELKDNGADFEFLDSIDNHSYIKQITDKYRIERKVPSFGDNVISKIIFFNKKDGCNYSNEFIKEIYQDFYNFFSNKIFSSKDDIKQSLPMNDVVYGYCWKIISEVYKQILSEEINESNISRSLTKMHSNWDKLTNAYVINFLHVIDAIDDSGNNIIKGAQLAENMLFGGNSNINHIIFEETKEVEEIALKESARAVNSVAKESKVTDLDKQNVNHDLQNKTTITSEERTLISKANNIKWEDLTKALCDSAGRNDFNMVQMILASDNDNRKLLNSFYSSATCLYYAANSGRMDMVALLLDKGADPNINSNFSPLYAAANKGDKEVVQLLLQRGADVNGAKGGSPLYAAANEGHTEIVQLLLQRGADVNGAKGNSPLYAAASSGHTEIVQLLLQRPGIDVNKCRGNSYTPLYGAASSGHTEIVQLLLQRGADVNGAKGNSPLYAAASSGHTEIVQLLLQRPGIDVNKCERGYPPLYGAAYGGHTEIVKFMLQQPGIDVNKCSSNRYSPLSATTRTGNIEIAKLLLEKGADVNGSCGNALYCAASSGHIEIAQFLLDRGANIN